MFSDPPASALIAEPKEISSILYAQGEEFVLGHAVEALCRAAVTFDPDFETLRESVAPLDG